MFLCPVWSWDRCRQTFVWTLLALVGRAHVGALTVFTLAGMAPGCIWAHRPRSMLLALIYWLVCNLKLCWAGFGQPLEATGPLCGYLVDSRPVRMCVNYLAAVFLCPAGLFTLPGPLVWVCECVHALLQICSSLPCDSRGLFDDRL